MRACLFLGCTPALRNPGRRNPRHLPDGVRIRRAIGHRQVTVEVAGSLGGLRDKSCVHLLPRTGHEECREAPTSPGGLQPDSGRTSINEITLFATSVAKGVTSIHLQMVGQRVKTPPAIESQHVRFDLAPKPVQQLESCSGGAESQLFLGQ